MAFSCVFVEHAITDLQNILDYISVNLSNPQAAKLFYEKINEAIELICDFPYSHQVYQSSFVHSENIRIANVDNYSMSYEIDEQNKSVAILRIIYSKRNLEELLKSI